MLRSEKHDTALSDGDEIKTVTSVGGRRVLASLWLRLELYASFIFTGLRLAVWILAGCMAVMVGYDDWRSLQAMIPLLVAAVVLACAEQSLVIFLKAAIEQRLADAQGVADYVTARVRRLPRAGRAIFGLAYLISAVAAILLPVIIELAWNKSLHFTNLQALLLSVGLTFLTSFSSNLVLSAALAAWGAPPRMTRAVFKHRLLIDAASAVLVGGGLLSLVQK